MPELRSWRRSVNAARVDDTYDTTPTTATQVTASATPHTVGTVTEIIAATDFDADMLVIEQTEQIGANSVNTGVLANVYVDTGTGDTLAVANIEFGGSTISNTGYFPRVYLPLKVPKGSQILMSIQGVVISETATFRVRAIPGNGGLRPGRRCVTYGADTATSKGVAVTPAAGSWGSWAQITATTTGGCRWIVPSVGNTNTAVTTGIRYLQLGVGAAASELVLGTWTHAIESTEGIVQHPVPISVNLPAGVRLAARMWATAGTTAGGVCIHGFE